MTGAGDVTPPIVTGAAPDPTTPLNLLPAPRLPIVLTVGGIPAPPAFVGIPYGLVAVTQINFLIPAGVPTGPQPVVVTIGDQLTGTVSSAAAMINVTQ